LRVIIRNELQGLRDAFNHIFLANEGHKIFSNLNSRVVRILRFKRNFYIGKAAVIF
jgi:hypothetical protein